MVVSVSSSYSTYFQHLIHLSFLVGNLSVLGFCVQHALLFHGLSFSLFSQLLLLCVLFENWHAAGYDQKLSDRPLPAPHLYSMPRRSYPLSLFSHLIRSDSHIGLHLYLGNWNCVLTCWVHFCTWVLGNCIARLQRLVGDEGNEEIGRVKKGFGFEHLSDWGCHLLRGNVGVGHFALFRRKSLKAILDHLSYRWPMRYSSGIFNRQLNS